MPDFLVKREGVSFAMSFIWGLSTMATLSEPPDPPPPSSSPPQPAPPSPTNSAAIPINVARTVPLISLLLELAGDRSRPVRDPSYSVGLSWMSRAYGESSTYNQRWRLASPLLIVRARRG